MLLDLNAGQDILDSKQYDCSDISSIPNALLFILFSLFFIYIKSVLKSTDTFLFPDAVLLVHATEGNVSESQ